MKRFSLLLLLAYTFSLGFWGCGITEPEEECSNTCPTAYDRECDDGGPGSLYNLCGYGTDCADCGAR